MTNRTSDHQLTELKRLLFPIEWDHLKDWHKNSAQLCSQVDDFVGARIHRDRFREMEALDKRK